MRSGIEIAGGRSRSSRVLGDSSDSTPLLGHRGRAGRVRKPHRSSHTHLRLRRLDWEWVVYQYAVSKFDWQQVLGGV